MYELYYWPSIQGRGEYVRLALEEAAAPYRDVARSPAGMNRSGRSPAPLDGVQAMMKMLAKRGDGVAPFAPPFLKAGKLVLAQTTNILLYLGDHHGLAPKNEAGRLAANQLQLTIADLVVEAHDTHHPIASSLYYEQQKSEAKKRSAIFIAERIPKFLGYFERVLEDAGGRFLLGARLSYVDLSMFQVIAGLRYSFPRAMKRHSKKYAGLAGLHDRVAARPRIAAYLASPRRIPFNEEGIFRHYPELDLKR